MFWAATEPYETLLDQLPPTCTRFRYLVMSVVTSFERPKCICGVADGKYVWVGCVHFIGTAGGWRGHLQSSVDTEVAFVWSIRDYGIRKYVAEQVGVGFLTRA